MNTEKVYESELTWAFHIWTDSYVGDPDEGIHIEERFLEFLHSKTDHETPYGPEQTLVLQPLEGSGTLEMVVENMIALMKDTEEELAVCLAENYESKGFKNVAKDLRELMLSFFNKQVIQSVEQE